MVKYIMVKTLIDGVTVSDGETEVIFNKGDRVLMAVPGNEDWPVVYSSTKGDWFDCAVDIDPNNELFYSNDSDVDIFEVIPHNKWTVPERYLIKSMNKYQPY